MTPRLHARLVALCGIVAWLAFVPQPGSHAATITWNTTTGLWSDNASWLGGTAPANNTTTDTAFFSQSNSDQAIQFGADRSITGITIANTGSTRFVSDSATARLLTLGASGFTINSGAGVVTLGTSSAPVNLAVTTESLTNNSSNLFTIGGNISRVSGDSTARSLTFAGSGNTTVSGSIFNGGSSNALAVTKSGAGTLSLAGGLGFSGGLTVSGGTVAVSGNASATSVGVLIAGASTSVPAAVSIASDAFVFGGSGDSSLGNAAGARGSLAISGSAGVTYSAGSTNYFNVGNSGAGVINQNGGSTTYGGGGVIFARNQNAYGGYLLSGGTATFNGTLFNIGNFGATVFRQTGGSGTSSTNVDIGYATGGVGIADFSGGTFTTGPSAGFMQAGRFQNNAGMAIVTVRDSAYVQVTGSNFLITSSTGEATGIVNLLGGTLEVNRIGKGAGAAARATLNADGGTLKVFTTNSGTGFLQGLDNAFVYSGGLKVDTNGQNVTIAQPLTAPAGYGVLASGSTLTVASGGSGYIAAPVVRFSSPAGGGVAATGLATIDVNGTVTGITITSPGSGYTLNESVTVTYNAGSNASGAAVSVAPAFTASASTLPSSGGLQKLGSGTLTLSGSNTFAGTTRIMAGSLSLGNANALQSSTLDMNSDDAGSVAFGITGTNTYVVGGLIGSRNIVTSGSVVLSVGGNGTSGTFLGVVSGGGALTKTGSGVLTLSGSNTFTGATTINAGVLEVTTLANGGVASGIGQSSNAATSLVFAAPSATLRYSGTSNVTTDRGFTLSSGGGGGGATIESSGAGTLSFDNTVAIAYGTTNQTGVLTLGGTNSGANTFSKVLANNGTGTTSFVKAGAGSWVLGATNTYSGSTSILGGRLIVGQTGSINNTSGISVSAGAGFDYNSSTALTVAPNLLGSGTASRASLGGTGSINAALTLNNLGDTLSPGNSPGIMPFGTSQTWNSFTYVWETNDFTGTGAGTAFDQIAITGSLSLTGAAESYLLDITSLTAGNLAGHVSNFSETNRSWTILTTTSGISGFNAANWTLSTANFMSSPAAAGSWSLSQQGNDLVLDYIGVPEPGTLALTGCGIAFMFWRYGGLRRRTTRPTETAS